MKAKLVVGLCLLLLLALAEAAALGRRGALKKAVRRRGASVATADVFIGYMDEEQYYTAVQVLEHKKQYSGVVVLERSNKNQQGAGSIPATPVENADDAGKAASLLFQRPVCDKDVYPTSTDGVWAYVPIKTKNYGDEPVQVCGKDKISKDTLDFLNSLKAELVKSSAARSAGLEDVWINNDLYPGIAKSKNALPLTFFIYAFGNIGAANNLAILIRTPEMGLNPSAVAPSVEVELAALKAAGVSKISFYAIGAGGAANAKDCAGSINFIQASWFGGVKVEAKKIAPLIAYDVVGKDKLATDVVLVDSGAAGASVDFTAVQKAFEGLKDKPPKTATDAKGDFEKAYPKALIGTTYTYFGGSESKKTSNALGGHSANMEDYHVIHIINDVQKDGGKNYPALDKEGIWRVDADPYSIEDGDVKALNEWLTSKSAFPTKTDLAKVLQWGVAGLKLSDIKDDNHVMCWDLVKARGAKEPAFLKKFIPVSDKIPNCVLNPFYVELALDFWETAGKKEFKDKMKKNGKTFADAVTAIYKTVPAQGDLSKDFTAVVEGLCEVVWDDFLTRSTILVVVKKDGKELTWVPVPALSNGQDLLKGGTNCPLWTRDNWGVYSKGTVQASEDKKTKYTPLSVIYWQFNGEGVDRAFYKASNLPGILNLNAKLFSGQGPHEFTDQSKLTKDCSK